MSEISLHEYCQQIEDKIEQGRYTEAVAHGKHILKQYPKHAATYQLLGKAMLEAGQGEYAADMFHRVLSVDPENMIAWVGLSEIHNQRNEMDTAVWHLERAFELAADNEIVEEELRRLYGQRDGVEVQRVQLTRGALARLYLKGALLSRAIGELRDLLEEYPERVDLRLALAEALWRNEQRLEAAEVCQQVLDELPYCLKANLILGEIWTSSGREEGQAYLRRAEAVDPENHTAQEIFGAISPLIAREAPIDRLEYTPPGEEERPGWMSEMAAAPEGEAPRVEGEAALVDVGAALETQIEIPPWLEEVVSEETPALGPPELAETPETEFLEETEGAPLEEIPEWMREIGEEAIEKPEQIAEEKPPDWLAEAGLEGAELEEEVAEQPVEPVVAPPSVPVEPEEGPGVPGEDEAPEWFAELGMEAEGEEAALPTSLEEEEPPDWLADIRGELAEAEEAEAPGETPPPVTEEGAPTRPEGEELPSAEIPDWLQELRPPEVAAVGITAPELEVAPEEAPAPPAEETFAEVEEAPPVEEAPKVEEEAAMPDWLEGEGLPSGDEALAWLEQLAEGKEEELRAQAQAEAEVRMAEIMGRPTPEEAPAMETTPEEAASPPVSAEVPDWLQELRPPEAEAVEITAPELEAAPEEAPAPPAEEAFAEVEEAPPVEEAPKVEEEAAMPDWLEGEGLPSGDEALAWLEQLAEGKEEELRAQAQAEAEVRMAEIMGRPRPEEAPAMETAAEIKEAPPVEEALPEETAAPPTEETVEPSAGEPFGWTAFGEPEAPIEAVAPEAEAIPEEAAAPSVEEAVAAEEEVPFGDETVTAAPPEEERPIAEEAAMPAWLEGEELPSGDEALAWLEELAEGKEEELRAQAQAEAEARMAEIMGRPRPEEAPAMEIAAEVGEAPTVEEALPEEIAAPPTEEAVAPPTGEPFGWTAFGEPEAPIEVIPEETAAPLVEEPIVAEEVAELRPAEEPEAPVEEAMPAPEAAPRQATEAMPSEEPAVPLMAELPPREETPPPVTEKPPEEAAPILEAPPPEVPVDDLTAKQAYLKEHPRDYEAWLSLARALWRAEKREEGLEAYSRLIRSGKLLEDVIPDLEMGQEQWPEASTQRVLGDAYMKAGRLQEALDTYRQALETL